MKRLLAMMVVAASLSGCGQKPPPLAGGKPVSYWVEALRNPDPGLRKTAVFKLGNVGPADPAALPAVLAALKDRDALVRREAVLALVKFGPAAREAVPGLGELLRDQDARVRLCAAKALEKLGKDVEAPR
jgi:HEAT repeat protein